MENSPSGCEDRILAMAALTLEAQALGQPALVSDWDEAGSDPCALTTWLSPWGRSGSPSLPAM